MATAIGLTTGSPAFFWAGKPPELGPLEYWNSAVSPSTPPRTRLGLLGSLPPSVSRTELLFPLFSLVLTAPDLCASAMLGKRINRFPWDLLHFTEPLSVLFQAPLHAWGSFLSSIFSTPSTAPLRLRLAKAADLLDRGLDWNLVHQITKLSPRESPDGWAALAWRSNDPASALEAVDAPLTSPWSQAFADYLASLAPEAVQRLPGNQQELLDLRSRGFAAVQRILFPKPHPVPASGQKLVLRHSRVFQRLVGSQLCPIALSFLEPEASALPFAPISWCIATFTWNMIVQDPDPGSTLRQGSGTPDPVVRLDWEVSP